MRIKPVDEFVHLGTFWGAARLTGRSSSREAIVSSSSRTYVLRFCLWCAFAMGALHKQVGFSTALSGFQRLCLTIGDFLFIGPAALSAKIQRPSRRPSPTQCREGDERALVPDGQPGWLAAAAVRLCLVWVSSSTPAARPLVTLSAASLARPHW